MKIALQMEKLKNKLQAVIFSLKSNFLCYWVPIFEIKELAAKHTCRRIAALFSENMTGRILSTCLYHQVMVTVASVFALYFSKGTTTHTLVLGRAPRFYP